MPPMRQKCQNARPPNWAINLYWACAFLNHATEPDGAVRRAYRKAYHPRKIERYGSKKARIYFLRETALLVFQTLKRPGQIVLHFGAQILFKFI